MTRRHVVLVTYGEPPDAGVPAQLRYSWRILRGLTRTVADIPAWVMPLIAVTRTRMRSRRWRAEGYRSPLEAITRAQAIGLQSALARRAPALEWRVHVAYEFRDPPLATVLDRIPADEPVEIVPMYVADSAFTHAIARATVERWRRRGGRRRREVRVLPPLAPEALAEVSARQIAQEARTRGIATRQAALVLAAHGTLLEPARPIDTGRVATERVAAAIAIRLAGEFGMIVHGWLNHLYGGPWTEPPIDVALRRVAEAGYRRVVYFPFGFIADNAESELEGRIALRTQSSLEAVHLPCLNESPALLDLLAGALARSAEEKPGDRHPGPPVAVHPRFWPGARGRAPTGRSGPRGASDPSRDP
ncbi:MAG TPA: ferrochelatase [Candidatus Eisenbacteria bacterium]